MKLIIDSNMAKMPGSCHECPLGFGGFCDWAPAETEGVCPDEGRPEWCPIHEAREDVVRCKECTYWDKDDSERELCMCKVLGTRTMPMWYCWAGLPWEDGETHG